jgi:hypothetical protein
MRLRWVAVEIFLAALIGTAVPTMTAPPSHASAVVPEAQAVFSFGDSCVVGVDVTDSRLQIHRFCADSSSTVSTSLGGSEVAFTRDSARVAATVAGWTVDLTWQATAKTKTIRNKTTATVTRSAPASIAGTVTDGTTTGGPPQLQMADLALVVNAR